MKSVPFIIVFILLCCVLSEGQNLKILENIDKVKVAKLDSLNSVYEETNLSITPDGKFLFFRSDRGGKPWSRYVSTNKNNCRADGDIYCSTNENGQWNKAVCLPKGINTGEAQDEPCISSDGKFIIYQSWARGWEYKGGPYYIARLNGTTWSEPLGLGGGINEFFVKHMDRYKRTATDGMSVSPDGKTLIFAWGQNYNDNMDLYRSKKTNGNWSYPERLGISTDKDERSVFIAGDNKTLFFASDGYSSSGGLDIYKTTMNDDGSFGEVLNIGEPFNSKQDDYGFILAATGNEAYFVRDGDIYRAFFPDTTKKPLPVVIAAAVKKDTIAEVIYKPEHKEHTFVINFDYDKTVIKDMYFKDLNNLADTLKSNHRLKLEIYGNTDSKGSDEYNLELGDKRAKAVKNYLANLGIAPERMYTLSFGKYKPLFHESPVADDANAAKNRRCEIWIKN